MLKHSFLVSLLSVLLFSCNSHSKKIPVTNTDVALTFIRDILDNNSKDAEQYLLKDETNLQYFQIIQQEYAKKSNTELTNYKSADILINEISNVSDSIAIVNYSNSYKKESTNKIKVVRIDGKWLVDLKYTFSGNL